MGCFSGCVPMWLFYLRHREQCTVLLATTKTLLGGPWLCSRSRPTLQLNKGTLLLELTSSWSWVLQVQSWLSFFFFFLSSVFFATSQKSAKKIFFDHIKSALNLEALSNAVVCKLGSCLSESLSSVRPRSPLIGLFPGIGKRLWNSKQPFTFFQSSHKGNIIPDIRENQKFSNTDWALTPMQEAFSLAQMGSPNQAID